MMIEQPPTTTRPEDTAFARELQRQLYQLVRVLDLCDRACVSELDVTVAQSYAVLALPATGSMTMHELSEAMNLAGSTMTRVVDQLVYKGLAERAPDDEDRRIVRVTLNEQGREVRAEVERRFQDVFAEVAGQVTKSDRQSFLRALGAVHRALSDGHGGCCPR